MLSSLNKNGKENMKIYILLSTIILSTLISGCTGLLFGGAIVGGTAVVSTINDRRSSGSILDDSNLEILISKKIFNNKYLHDYSHTNLTVFNGVVLVTGEASSKEVANGIIKIIQNTNNVKSIREDIAIMSTSSILSRTNDATITGKVKASLLSIKIPDFNPGLVNVSTERGKVYLMGLVTKEEAKSIIYRARLVRGVKSVINLFEYIPPK